MPDETPFQPMLPKAKEDYGGNLVGQLNINDHLATSRQLQLLGRATYWGRLSVNRPPGPLDSAPE
jgi:hypothetical protein